jgi:hypothetical protein
MSEHHIILLMYVSMKTLIYCLNKLKIEKDSEIYRNALALVQKVPLEFVNNTNNGSNEWISAMKIIAYAYSSVKNNNNDNDTSSYIFSQSQLSDFLTLSAKGIEEKRMSSEIINSIIFKIYRDITENYQELSQSLKSNYPIIIVDVVSISKHGIDTKGTKVSSIGIEKYYQSRKQQATMAEEGEEETARTAATTSAAIRKNKIRLSSLNLKSLVENLSQITNRERKELEESLERLRGSDLKKISELCHNHSRLQHYSKLITKEGSQEEFKNEIQRELGRRLRSHQLGRAANSIRRLRTYIENILDNKFIPDASHGINHVKHNIEYGYQLMNLIERTRRRQRD